MSSLEPDEGVDIGWWYRPSHQPPVDSLSSFALADDAPHPGFSHFLEPTPKLVTSSSFGPTALSPTASNCWAADEALNAKPASTHPFHQDDSDSILSRDELPQYVPATYEQPAEFFAAENCSYF